MIALLLACTGAETPSSITEMTATVSPAIATVVTVTWTTDTATTGQIAFGVGDQALTTPMETVPATTHSAVLLGLSALTEATWRVVLSDGTMSEVQSVTTGILSNALPTLTAEGTHDHYTVVPMLGGVTGPSIISPDGEFVWFHEDTRGLDVYRARLSVDGASVLYNAASVSGDPADDSVLVRVSLDGTTESTIPVPLLAHDFVELEDGTIVAIAVEFREVDGVEVRGDRLVEISPDGVQTDIWSAWDCFDPAVDVGTDQEIGWTFANALDYDAEEDAFYLSMRHFSSITKIPRGTRTCEWTFGTTGATFSPDDRFLHEHQFEVLEDSLLVFDNAGGGSASRAIEYAFDPDAGEAETLWEYTSDPSIFTFVLGDVARLADGDTVVDFAVGGALHRVSPEGELEWQLSTELGYAYGFFSQVPSLY